MKFIKLIFLVKNNIFNWFQNLKKLKIYCPLKLKSKLKFTITGYVLNIQNNRKKLKSIAEFKPKIETFHFGFKSCCKRFVF